jgi:hypothetical protein
VPYQEGAQAKQPDAYLRVVEQRGDRFRIGIGETTGDPAVDWYGHGALDGWSGRHDWVFGDGKSGRTTFTIDDYGNLHGKVRGSGIDVGLLRSTPPVRLRPG